VNIVTLCNVIPCIEVDK